MSDGGPTPEELAIIRAWRDKGSHPDYHDDQMLRLRREWPTLANAIERLAQRFGQ